MYIDEIPEDVYALGVKSSIKDLTDFDEYLFNNKPNDEQLVETNSCEQSEENTSNQAVTISKDVEKGRSVANDVSQDD